MKYIIYCTGVDYYAHFSKSSKCKDFESCISYTNIGEGLRMLASESPGLLEYLDFEDIKPSNKI